MAPKLVFHVGREACFPLPTCNLLNTARVVANQSESAVMITKIKDNLNLWGFAPAKLMGRFANSHAPKILANSIPKSGTHLMERLLYLLPGISRQLAGTCCVQEPAAFAQQCARLRKGQFLVAHLYYKDAFLKIV